MVYYVTVTIVRVGLLAAILMISPRRICTPKSRLATVNIRPGTKGIELRLILLIGTTR